jgi:protein ImuB
VLPGLRYAAAFSLASGLRAGQVSSAEIDKAIALLTEELIRFSPEVEPATEEPGVFWLNGTGLNRLYTSAQKWGYAIHRGIQAQGFQAGVVVGFTRFGTYAVARVKKGITVFSDPAEEKRVVQKVPLDRLDLEPSFRDTLFKLGVKTVGALLVLPAAGLRERFGQRAYRLYRMAAGELWTPFAPCRPEEPVRQRRILDDPEGDVTRLLFLVKQLLHPMLAALAARTQALAGLWLDFLIDRGGRLKEQVRPAAPTLEAVQVLDLVRLRLESIQFSAGVMEIELSAEAAPATIEQLRLFGEGAARDLDAANRALARLRAEFGDEAVVCARLADGHLPEARFVWEPLIRVRLPKNDLNPSTALRAGSAERLNVLTPPRMLVRRIMAKPLPLSSAPHHSHEDGWLVLGPRYGPVDKLTGPYVFSGGWWHREIQRDYYFAETRRGDLLWLYYDRIRRRWFLQGAIE